MNTLQRRLVLGTLVLTLPALRLSAAESPSVRVPLRWVGAAPAAVVHVESLDSSNHAAGGFDVAPVRSSVEIPVSTNVVKYRFTAAGFVPADVARDRLAYGALLRAFGSVVVEIDAEPRSRGPVALTVHIVEDRPDPRGISRTVPVFRRGEYPFQAPPGLWHLLIDDGMSAPRIVEGVSVAPGETRRVRPPAASPGRAETHTVTDLGGKAIQGAEFRWNGIPGSPVNGLFQRWITSRNLSTARDGRVRIDRLPTAAHTWAIRADGFRTRIREIPAREPGDRRAEAHFQDQLRRLPSLRIRINDRTGESPAASVSVWRIPPRGTLAAAVSNDYPVWKGAIVSETIVPALPGGFYRAEVTLPGIVAVAERTIDDSEEASDVQDLTVDVVRKLVRGRITRSDAPVADVSVEAVPNDSAIGASTTRLARAKTGPDGSFSLSFSYRGVVSVTASTDTISKTKNIDLIGDDEADATFEFRPARVLLHAVDRKTGDPVAAAEMATEFIPAGHFSEGIRLATADAAGELVLEDLSDGVLKVTASAKGYATRVLRDVPVPFDGESEMRVELARSAPFRIRVLDEFAAPVASAEILVERDPHVRKPRQCPLKTLGRTNESGELVLDELTGEQTPAYVVASGLSAQAFWLPNAADPDGGAEGNTVEVVTTHHATAPGIRVMGSGGGYREDAVLVFEKNGIEVPFSVISRAAEANGLTPQALFQRGDRAIHYHELLAPGRYGVEVLSPRPGAADDPSQDMKDVLGTVVLPPAATVDLLWKENRAYPPGAPQ